MHEKTVLETACDALEQEFKRIHDLITPITNHPLGEPGEQIVERSRDKFGDIIVEVNSRLQIIKRVIKENDVNIEDGWRAYVELKTDWIPSLSNELLAVIGGIYIIDAKLDYVSDFGSDSKPENRRPTITKRFSEIAQMMVEELNDRSQRGWVPVLIVGEERLGHSTPGIIRLRFPACDIWHLPFTAHEYGYLVAQIQPPPPLKTFKNEVWSKVDPTEHKENFPPTDQPCFLAMVRRFWDSYYKLSPGDQKDFPKQEVDTLRKQQETHLCRLFADAFATFFVGPAYVFALVHLRFIPNETLYEPSAAMPAFAHRFVFALETLKWMNENADGESPFSGELETATGIPGLWRMTVQSTKSGDYYEQIAENYKPWLSQVKEILKKSFSEGLKDTLTHWRIAKKLKEEITKVGLKVDTWPSMWAVLNAAWLARWDRATQWPTIQTNALRLLEKSDQELLKREDSSRRNAPKDEKENWSINEAIDTIKAVLIKEKDTETLIRFMEMCKSQDGFNKQDEKIITSLANSGETNAVKAYVWLCQKK